MHISTLVGLAASIVGTQALSQGFNYGATQSDGSTPMEQSDYEAQFKRAQSLQGTSGWTSARLYTMIQSGTTDTASAAFQAAIDTKTQLLLGIWCSGGQEVVTNELNALKSAIQQYGSAFTDLVVGISVGSEDLYRVSPTGIKNKSGYGATPDEIVSYVKQTRDAIKGTGLSATSIGHVDTWTAYQNGSNAAVIEAIDWLGMDTYPYFENTVENSIDNCNKTFWDAYDVTAGASGGKEVWITETGWPVSGDVSGEAVPSIKNAETYWQEIACALIGNYNTFWYTLTDSIPTTPNPSFGIIGNNLNSAPLYDLTCKKQPKKPKTSKGGDKDGKDGKDGKSGSKKPSGGSIGDGKGHGSGYGHSHGHGPYHGSGSNSTAGMGTATASHGGYPSATGSMGSGMTGGSGSGSPSSTSGAPYSAPTGAATRASSAVGAGILAIFALVAAL